MSDDDDPSEVYSSFEVKSDPWAMARLHVPDCRDEVLALGFEHLGYVFTRVPNIPWERAQVGYTTEVLRHPEGGAFCHLDLYWDLPLVAFETILEDGTIVKTRLVPEEVFRVSRFSRLVFVSRPNAGRHSRTLHDGTVTAAWRAHADAMRQQAKRRQSPLCAHDALDLWFAIQERGVAISAETGSVFVYVFFAGVAAFLTLTLFGGLGLAEVAGIPRLVGVVALLALASMPWWPWVVFIGSATRLPLEPAATLRVRPAVQERIGDHEALASLPDPALADD